MTDLQISRALALAIGWQRSDIMECNWHPFLLVWFDSAWRGFDYRAWDVIGPIAARYDCFPHRYNREGSVYNGTWVTHQTHYFADTPQKAIALATIEGAKK